MSSATSSSNIFIDISKDLTSASTLQSLLTSHEPAGFQLVGGLNDYATRPVSEAAAAKASASVTPTKVASWKTGNGINFSLPNARSQSRPLAKKLLRCDGYRVDEYQKHAERVGRPH